MVYNPNSILSLQHLLYLDNGLEFLPLLNPTAQLKLRENENVKKKKKARRFWRLSVDFLMFGSWGSVREKTSRRSPTEQGRGRLIFPRLLTHSYIIILSPRIKQTAARCPHSWEPAERVRHGAHAMHIT